MKPLCYGVCVQTNWRRMSLCCPRSAGTALQAWSVACIRTAGLKFFARSWFGLTLTGCAAYKFSAMSTLTESNKENQAGLQAHPAKLQKVDGISTLQVKLLSDAATVPRRGSARAAGYDLASAADCIVPARGKAVVPTDLAIAIPPNTYARVAPRSGLAVKHFIDTAAGVVDEDYRGAVGVVLYNHGSDDFVVKRGDRIAQLILERIMTPEVEVVQELGSTVRGAGAYGSTGIGG